MIIKKIALLLLVSFIVTACSSKPQRPKATKIFVTNISDTGLKVFNFSITRDTSKRGSGGGKGKGKGKGGGMGGGKGGMGGNHGGQGGGKNGNQEEMNTKFEAKMVDELEIRLDQNSYCRQGYTEIESYFSRGSGQIRGECNEVATERDRQTFINNQYNRY